MRLEIILQCGPDGIRGLFITMPFDGRTLLGEVITYYSVSRRRGGYRLKVRHFNGEPWPIDPRVDRVTVLERDS